MVKLNLGCGSRKLAGYVNIDREPRAEPDIVHDLEKTPWPFDDDTVDAIAAYHVLEHLGQDVSTYFDVIKEIYRICKADAILDIVVPHPRSDDFIRDPTHVRAITAGGLEMFCQRLNREWIEKGGADTPLGIYHAVDFEVETVEMILAPEWAQRLERGEIDIADVQRAAKTYWNVVDATRITVRIVKGKPARRDAS